MKALNLIIQREFNSRVKKKSFIILTLLIPFLFAGLIFLPLLISQVKDTEEKKVVVIDRTGIYASHFQSSKYIHFEVLDDTGESERPKAGGDIFALLEITDNLDKNPQAATIYSEKQPPMELLMYINQTLSEVNKEFKLGQYANNLDIDKEALVPIQKILQSKNISVNTIRWDADGVEKETSIEMASGIGFTLVMLMYMFILTYGAMVMQGVIEEKTNRIVEVMVSSVRPFDLMMGKIIGIGLTGFFQLFVWIVMGVLIYLLKDSFFPAASGEEMVSGGFMAYINLLPTVNWSYIITFFILFFIGGYLFYAALFAMFASAVDNPQDTQQFVMPVTIIFIFSLFVGMYSVQNPDGPLAFWCSMIPFTSPIVMMVRIPAEIPFWETMVSLTILYVFVVLVTRFAAKIYRVGILMYGKKPTMKELYKWFKYK